MGVSRSICVRALEMAAVQPDVSPRVAKAYACWLCSSCPQARALPAPRTGQGGLGERHRLCGLPLTGGVSPRVLLGGQLPVVAVVGCGVQGVAMVLPR